MLTEPSHSSSTNIRKPVSTSPAAKSTFVPQHYGTMGSFDTMMTDLILRHPNVGRQRIVDTLVELTAQHQGELGGLSIETIKDMISDLLMRPASVTQV